MILQIIVWDRLSDGITDVFERYVSPAKLKNREKSMQIVPDGEGQDALARALERGEQWKQGMLDAALRAPGMLRPKDAVIQSHLSRSRLDALQRDGRVLALRRDDVRLYPAWQFLNDGYEPRVGEILKLFSEYDPFWTYHQLTSPQSLLAGKRPSDLIRRRAFSRLHLWASRFLSAEQGAQ